MVSPLAFDVREQVEHLGRNLLLALVVDRRFIGLVVGDFRVFVVERRAQARTRDHRAVFIGVRARHHRSKVFVWIDGVVVLLRKAFACRLRVRERNLFVRVIARGRFELVSGALDSSDRFDSLEGHEPRGKIDSSRAVMRAKRDPRSLSFTARSVSEHRGSRGFAAHEKWNAVDAVVRIGIRECHGDTRGGSSSLMRTAAEMPASIPPTTTMLGLIWFSS